MSVIYLYGCNADYEQELNGQDEQRAHEEKRCKGAPVCGYCLDELDEKNERMKDDE